MSEQNYKIAHAAGQDAGDRSAKERSLAQWDEIAWNAAAEVFDKVMRALQP